MTPDYWPDAVAVLSTADPILARLIAAYPGEALVSREDAFGTLARSIVGQQITVVVASRLWTRKRLRFVHEPSPGMQQFWSPR